MTYGKTVLAYLTGWMIVQPVYNRLLREWRKRQLENPGSETQAYFREQAQAFVAALSDYTPGQRPPAALEVIVAQHGRIERMLAGEREREAAAVDVVLRYRRGELTAEQAVELISAQGVR